MKRFVASLVLTIAVSLLTTLAWASGQTALLTWTNATGFTDGSSFTAAEQAAVRVMICWAPVSTTGATDNGCQLSGAAATTMSVHVNCGQVTFTAVTYLQVAGYNGPAEGPATAPITYDTGLQCVRGVSNAKVSD